MPDLSLQQTLNCSAHKAFKVTKALTFCPRWNDLSTRTYCRCSIARCTWTEGVSGVAPVQDEMEFTTFAR